MNVMGNIRSIPHFFRNVKRSWEIIAVLRKYGLADWLRRTNVELPKTENGDGEVVAVVLTREARIRLALTELGPTFIKLGQLMSTRPDLFGVPLANELKQLQSATPADTPAQVRLIVETELGQPIEDLYDDFELIPIASASIGQVHKARLKTGERVVVKVQHANIDSKVNEDLEVLSNLAQLAEQFEDFQPYRPQVNSAELGRTLRRELDFGREERNLHQFNILFQDDATVCIPKAYTELCTARVLTMSMVDGLAIEDTLALDAAGINREEVARRGAELYLQMIFVHGFFHADPHPGNILIMPGDIIGLIDFGMVGRIEERLREDIEEMLLAMVQHDVPMLTRIIKRIGQTPANLDESALANDVADFVGNYSTQSLDQFDLSGALLDMTEIIRRYRIMLSPQVALLIKVLVTLEGSTKLLSPRFSLMEVMQPFQKKMLLRRLSPARQLRKLRRLWVEMEYLAEVVPQQITRIMEQIQAGKFDVHLDHRGLGPSVNRLVLGMLASALFLGSSWMLANQVEPMIPPEKLFGYDLKWLHDDGWLPKLSVLGMVGCVTSILVGLRLLWAIGKSGHLDQMKSK